MLHHSDVFRNCIAQSAYFEKDFVVIQELKELLENKGYKTAYREWPGVHSWLTWSRGIGGGIAFVLASRELE